MITATGMDRGHEITAKVDHVINRGGWFGKTWLIGIGCGYSTFFYVGEADNQGDAIDEFVDSKHGHLLKIDEEEVEKKDREYKALLELGKEDEFEDFPFRGGDFGDPIDLDDVTVLCRCEVNYFAPRTTECINHTPIS